MEALRHTAEGISVLKDWLGSGAIPVSQEQAERRANICVNCPMNVEPLWWEKSKELIAATIRRHLEVKNDMALTLPNEGALSMCRACGCAIPLKVWCPIEHIKENTSEATMKRFVPYCWIRKEIE